jgi:ribosomal protein S18 acetylase RimI-like enzyme
VDDGSLRGRLWDGFAELQMLLGAHAGQGKTLQREGLVASIVPNAPDSPTLNAAVALEPDAAVQQVKELARLYSHARVRRWGVWMDGGASLAAQALTRAGFVVTAASPGMGTVLDASLEDGEPLPADLATVGKVNDLAYGNFDGRLERTLNPLPNGALRGYRVDVDGSPAAVALALHHGDDCGVSFVATVPKQRRRGLARQVMLHALADAVKSGCTTSTLQATDVGERLYEGLGYQRLCLMQLWERRR